METNISTKIKITARAISPSTGKSVKCQVKQTIPNFNSFSIKIPAIQEREIGTLSTAVQFETHAKTTKEYSSKKINSSGSSNLKKPLEKAAALELNQNQPELQQRMTRSKACETPLVFQGTGENSSKKINPSGSSNLKRLKPLEKAAAPDLKQNQQQQKRTDKAYQLVLAKAKPKALEKVNIGEVILCRLKGYPAWPCRVTDVEKNMISVKFFGDGTTTKTSIKNCFSFIDSVETCLSVLRSRKTPLFSKSVKEAESVLGIPMEKSIFRLVQ